MCVFVCLFVYTMLQLSCVPIITLIDQFHWNRRAFEFFKYPLALILILSYDNNLKKVRRELLVWVYSSLFSKYN